jgi:hypothetical protein
MHEPRARVLIESPGVFVAARPPIPTIVLDILISASKDIIIQDVKG